MKPTLLSRFGWAFVSASTLVLATCSSDSDTTVAGGTVCGPSARASASGGGSTPARTGTFPLMTGLGSHTHKITTSSPDTQAYFDQGYNYLFNFNHAAAISSFQEGLKRDPDCAMCWWGIAFAHGPNINMPMMPDAVAPAYAAAQKAKELAPKVSRAEQAYIAAIVKRYSDDPKHDRQTLDAGFAAAMRDVAKKYPNDLDASVLYAEALMDTSPWNYWRADKRTPNPGIEPLIPTLERVLARAPNHPGAIHLYIHAVEASTSPQRAEAGADRLTTMLPGAGHLVHMPTHIYNRIGRYDDGVKWNQLATKADEAYFDKTSDRGMYSAMYYVHNMHFVWTAASTEGRSETALEYAGRVTQNVNPDMARAVPGIELFVPTVLYTQLRFGKWDEILDTSAPDPQLHLATAIYHYARARAFAAKGDAAKAASEQALIKPSFSSEDATRFEQFGVPGQDMINIAAHVAMADVHRARKNSAAEIKELREAVRLQDVLKYTEPPYWDFPVRHNLGAALLAAGRTKEAEQVYRADLREWPKNGWALFGLAQALAAEGRKREAANAEASFKDAWARADVALTQSRF